MNFLVLLKLPHPPARGEGALVVNPLPLREGDRGRGENCNSSHSSRPESCGGFTLIEIIVVMLIIGIVLSVISVNLSPDRESAVREEAQRLALLLQTAQQEAILQGKVLAVALEREGYAFQILNEKLEFKPLDGDEVLRVRLLPPGIVISGVDIEGAPENNDKDPPRLILLPTGELPAFTITFSRDKIRWQVKSEIAGKIAARSAPLPERT